MNSVYVTASFASATALLSLLASGNPLPEPYQYTLQYDGYFLNCESLDEVCKGTKNKSEATIFEQKQYSNDDIHASGLCLNPQNGQDASPIIKKECHLRYNFQLDKPAQLNEVQGKKKIEDQYVFYRADNGVGPFKWGETHCNAHITNDGKVECIWTDKMNGKSN
eukprot:Pgem_evm1s1213